MRRLKFRPSLAQVRRDNQQALDYYRAISARPDAPRIDVGAKEKVERTPHVKGSGEDGVVDSISKYLRLHPRVSIAIRVNRGAVTGGDSYVQFNRLIKGRGVIVDFIGTMVDGKPFALEAKHPLWTMPGPSAGGEEALRCREQAHFLENVRDVGGLAGFARSVDDAVKILGKNS